MIITAHLWRELSLTLNLSCPGSSQISTDGSLVVFVAEKLATNYKVLFMAFLKHINFVHCKPRQRSHNVVG